MNSKDYLNRIKEELLSRLTARDSYKVYETLLSDLGQYGDKFTAKSPFNPNENTASFKIFLPNDGKYFCWKDFSSDNGGDVFSFVEMMENCDFKTALKRVVEIAGINMSGNGRDKRTYEIGTKKNENGHQNVNYEEPAIPAKKKRKI